MLPWAEFSFAKAAWHLKKWNAHSGEHFICILVFHSISWKKWKMKKIAAALCWLVPKELGVCKISAPWHQGVLISKENPTRRPLPYLKPLKPHNRTAFPRHFKILFDFKTVKLTVHCSQTQYNGQKSIGKWCPSDEEMDDRRLSTPVQAWEARLVPKLPCYRTPSAPHAKRTCFVVGVVVVAGLICRSALNPHNCL